MSRSPWRKLAWDNAWAARKLIQDGAWRSAVSRSYYALYSAIVERVERLGPFGGGRANPSHDKLPGLIDQVKNLDGLERKQLRKQVKQLFRMRVMADYLPDAVIDKDFAKEALSRCTTSFVILGIGDGGL